MYSADVDKMIEKCLLRSPSVSQVAARRSATLLNKTPSNVFFKDSAKIINYLFLFLYRGTTIFKEYLLGKNKHKIKS